MHLGFRAEVIKPLKMHSSAKLVLRNAPQLGGWGNNYSERTINNVINIKKVCDFIKNYDIVLVAYENEKQNNFCFGGGAYRVPAGVCRLFNQQ